MTRTRSLSQTVAIVLMAVILILYALPYIYLVLTSFKPPTDVLSIPPTLLPEHFSLENYRDSAGCRTSSATLPTAWSSPPSAPS